MDMRHDLLINDEEYRNKIIDECIKEKDILGIKKMVTCILQEAKKEVFGDIEDLINILKIDLKIMLKAKNKSACNKLGFAIENLEGIKKRHLLPSTEGALNSRTIQSAVNPNYLKKSKRTQKKFLKECSDMIAD